MVLFSQSVVSPRRFKWDVKVDPCPYFDNYAKFITEQEGKRFVRSNVPLKEEDEKKAELAVPVVRPSAPSNTTWIAK